MAKRRTLRRHHKKIIGTSKAHVMAIGHTKSHVMAIPELRRAFEHIEAYARTHAHDVDGLRAEWKRVFYKPLDKPSAEEYLKHMNNYSSPVEERRGATRKLRRGYAAQGGSAPLAGAPIGYDMRPGIHITAGIDAGSYAGVPKYVASGFWNPEIAQTYDPVPGQTAYPTRTPAGMGENTVRGGACPCDMPQLGGYGGKATKTKTKTKRKLRKGGGMLGDALRGLVGSSVPSTPLQDAIRLANGQQAGSPSPSAVDGPIKP